MGKRDRASIEEGLFQQGELELWSRLKVQDIRASLFDRQLEPFDVPDEDARIVCVCSRRAGKTTLVVAKLLAVALQHPESICLYLNLTRGEAYDTAWSILLEFDRRFVLHARTDRKRFVLPNGSEVRLRGCADESDKEKLRGKKYRIVVVDETKSWPTKWFSEAIKEVIMPALMDERGGLWMIGTPGPSRLGLFFEASQEGSGWTNFSWTAHSNPHVDYGDWLADQKQQLGLSEDDADYRREYLGEWAEDQDRRAYKYDERLNGISSEELQAVLREKQDRLAYVLGVDLGSLSGDPDGYVLLAFDRLSPALWVVEQRKENVMGSDQTAEIILDLKKRYPIRNIVVDDIGGAGKKITEDFVRRYSLITESAQKDKKALARSWLNSELRTGALKVLRGSPLTREWKELELDEQGNELERCANHLADACLYAYRRVRPYREPKAVERKPNPHDPNFMQEVHPMLLEQRLKRQQRDQSAAPRGRLQWPGTPRWKSKPEPRKGQAGR